MDMEFASLVKFIKESYHCFQDIRNVWDGWIAGLNAVADGISDFGNLRVLFFVLI